MSHLVVFALIGLMAGATTRLLYPGRRLTRVLASVGIGVVGALAAGMISWSYWPFVDAQFQLGNLIVSLLGALGLLMIWAGVQYVRRINGYSTQSL